MLKNKKQNYLWHWIQLNFKNTPKMTSIIHTTKLVIYENMESENAYIWSQIKASWSGQLVFSCDSGHCFSPESALQQKRKHPFVGPLKKKNLLAVFSVPQVFILSWNCTPMVNSYVRIWSGEVTNTRMTARPVLHTLFIHFLVFVLTWSSWSNVFS